MTGVRSPRRTAHRDPAARPHRRSLSAGRHLVVESGLDDHDFLPMVPIIEAAGGTITDWSGRSIGPHSDGDVLAAASPELHAAALAVLQGRALQAH